MPKYVANGTKSTHRFTFLVDGEPVVPFSANYTLLDNAKNVVGGLDEEDILLNTYSTSYVINIDAEDNETALPNGVRYLNVKFMYDDIEYSLNQYYLLRDDVDFPLSPSEVAAVMGVTVPDDYIDILHAYDLVQADVGSTVDLSLILQDGTELLPTLIDAVKYKAAILTSGGIENSMFQMEQSDNTLYKRFEKIDFMGLKNNLVALYNQALNLLLGKTDGGSTPTYSIIAQGPDAITGV